jgi:hypothetical protein
MPRLYQSIAGAILGLVAFTARPSIAPAQEFFAPTYSRTRMGADDWRSSGGGHWHVRGGGGYAYGNNFYPPYFSSVISGYWYERPYPYHFDYYRHRWSAAESGPFVSASESTENCPCPAEMLNAPHAPSEEGLSESEGAPTQR